MVAYDAEIRSKKMVNLVQKTRIVVEKSPLRSNPLAPWEDERNRLGYNS
jgi:hypothetical protein